MKIHSEQLDYLLRQEQLNKSATSVPTEDFGSLFNQEVERVQAEAQEVLPPPGARTASIDPMLLAGMEEIPGTESGLDDADTAMMRTFMEQADDSLQTLDGYAAALGKGENPARDAWQMLQNLDGRVSAMRESMGRMSANASAGLEDVVNELEVLAATEKFKFNRGDYL